MRKKIGRPKAFDEEEALQKAMYYFWEHGYESASLADLLDVMGIKKSSFYQTFSSKEKIFTKSLELYTKNSIYYFNSLKQKHGAKETLIKVMYLLLEEVQNTGNSKGCLVMNSGGECYAKFGHLTPLVREKFKTFQKLFMEFIIEAQQLGDIKNATDAFVLVTVYQSIINGASAMVRAGAGEEEIKVLITEIERLLE